MIGIVDEDFIQPAQGAFVSIHLESRSDLMITFGFIQVGTAGIYNIVETRLHPNVVETRLHPNGRYNVAAIRLNSGIQCETETGGLIRRGEVARSLTLKQVRSLAVENQSRPHGPLPDYLSSLATGWGDSREARYEPSIRPPNDSRYWRGECDRLVREKMNNDMQLREYLYSSAQSSIDRALQEYEIGYYELSQNLMRAAPVVEYRPLDPTGGLWELGRIVFNRPVYRMHSNINPEIRVELAIENRAGRSTEALTRFRHSFGFGFTHSSSMPKVPKGCVGCSNLHGKAYTGEHGRNMFICAMYPSGYQGEGSCPDKI